MVDGPRLQRARTGPKGRFLAIGLIAAAHLAGCGASPPRVLESARRVQARDFRDPNAPPAAPEPVPVYQQERPRAPRVEIRTLSEEEARADIGPLRTEPGRPVLGGEPDDPVLLARPSSGPARLTLVDAKVGDINGRPIVAEQWLEPMADRLRAESAGRTREQWRAFALEEIRSRLVTDLSNELFLGEARASLTPEQKVGLRVFLQRFERETVSGNYGSATLTDEYLRRTQGQTLEEAKRERERAVLIIEQLRKVVWDRVQVSMRDIRNEYDRNIDVYQPDPVAVFSLISLPASNQAAVEEFTAAIGTRPFAELVADERNRVRQPQEFALSGTLAESELFGLAPLAEAARTLSPGEHAGPITVGSSVFWVHLDRIEESFTSLYDAQRELRDTITARRREEEERRYLYKLFNRAGIRDADLNSLILLLVDVAEEWCYQPQ